MRGRVKYPQSRLSDVDMTSAPSDVLKKPILPWALDYYCSELVKPTLSLVAGCEGTNDGESTNIYHVTLIPLLVESWYQLLHPCLPHYCPSAWSKFTLNNWRLHHRRTVGFRRISADSTCSFSLPVHILFRVYSPNPVVHHPNDCKETVRLPGTMISHITSNES